MLQNISKVTVLKANYRSNSQSSQSKLLMINCVEKLILFKYFLIIKIIIKAELRKGSTKTKTLA